MLGMPDPTPYDLKFRFLGIPVRVTPWFWLGTVMIGPHDPGQAREMIVFIACAFVSILLHEFGHGLMAKAFGYRAEIALFALGGLCASESERQTPGQRLAVLAAGPGIQFVFLFLIILVGNAALGLTWKGDLALAQSLLGIQTTDASGLLNVLVALGPGQDSPVGQAFFYLFQINLLWPLLNLLPIWPLDGGQITQVLLVRANRRNGARWSHIVSMVVAGLLVAYILGQFKAGTNEGGFLRVLFFGWFALINYQMLQAYHSRHVQYGHEEDESDWWKR